MEFYGDFIPYHSEAEFMAAFVFAIVPTIIAYLKGRSILGMYLFSMVATPVFGFVVSIFLPLNRKALFERKYVVDVESQLKIRDLEKRCKELEDMVDNKNKKNVGF